MRRVDCHIFDGLAVKVVVLSVIPGGSDWERSLLKVVLSLLSCMESYRGLSAVSVGDNLRLGRALASVAHPSMPLVTRRFDSEWLTDLFRRKFIEESSGLEPFSILEYFRFRLSAVIEDSAFNNMPCLREVCLFCFCCFALFLSFCCGGGCCDRMCSSALLFDDLSNEECRACRCADHPLNFSGDSVLVCAWRGQPISRVVRTGHRTSRALGQSGGLLRSPSSKHGR